MAKSIVKEVPGVALARAEAAALAAAHRRGIAPRLLGTERTEDGALLLIRRTGRQFPRRPTFAQVRALARALAALHRIPVPAAVRRLPASLVPPSLAEGGRILVAGLGQLSADRRFTARQRDALGVWRVAATAASRFLAAFDDEWTPPGVTLCHGDLKAENLRLAGGRVELIDFGSVCRAEPAWELAHCALALELSPELEDILVCDYLAERRGLARLGVRMQAWRLLLSASVPLQWMLEAQPVTARVHERLARHLAAARVELGRLGDTSLPSLAAAFRRVDTGRVAAPHRRSRARAGRTGPRRRTGRR